MSSETSFLGIFIGYNNAKLLNFTLLNFGLPKVQANQMHPAMCISIQTILPKLPTFLVLQDMSLNRNPHLNKETLTLPFMLPMYLVVLALKPVPLWPHRVKSLTHNIIYIHRVVLFASQDRYIKYIF